MSELVVTEHLRHILQFPFGERRVYFRRLGKGVSRFRLLIPFPQVADKRANTP